MRVFIYLLIVTLGFYSSSILGQSTKDKLDYANELYYSNPDSSYIICTSIEDNLKNTNNDIDIAEAQLCRARYLLLKTRFDEATDLLNKASSTFKEKNKLASLAKCYSIKSILLDRISNQEEALFYQKTSLALYTQIGDIEGQMNALTNLSLDFLDIHENDSALYYLVKLKRFENEMIPSTKYYMHQNFGSYYYNIEDYHASIDAYNKAIIIAQDENMIDSKTTCLMLMAKTYLAIKEYSKSEKLLHQSIEIATANKLLHESNEAYVLLIKIHEAQGNYKEAFRIEKINDKIEKEIYDLDKINKINEIESRLKLTEKENIIAQKELDLKNEQLNTIEAKSKITQLIFLVAFSVIIIIFIIFILLRARKLNAKISAQKMMLQEKNIEITDSINYAKRIQSAILPADSFFKKHLPNSFIFYKPKDIVAGDFYWMQTINDNILFAAADCTGHGVPGAMVSVVCSNSLNESLKTLKTSKPSEIIELTRDLVKESLNKENENYITDGMDIALCSLNTKTNEIEFTGANNPLWIIRAGKLIEIKGDKQPVGNHLNEVPFSNHKYQLEKDDVLYIFSDGYADQFGGPKGKKFMYKQFKQLVLNNINKPISEQGHILSDNFEKWKGDLEQIDDVCVIGVRI